MANTNSRVDCLESDHVESHQFAGFSMDFTSEKRSKLLKESLAKGGIPPPSDVQQEEEYAPDVSVALEELPASPVPPREDPRHQTHNSKPGISGVSFTIPQIQCFGMDKISEGWHSLKYGTALKQEQGKLVFPNGTVYGPKTVDLYCI